MTEAYEITIRDFEIELHHTDWWRFTEIYYLNKQIEKYKELLNCLRAEWIK